MSDYYRPTYHDTDNEDDSHGSTSSMQDSHPEPRERSGGRPQDDLDLSTTRQRRLLRSRQVEQAYDVESALAEERAIQALRDNPSSVASISNQADFDRSFVQLASQHSDYLSRRLRTRPSRIEVRPQSRRQDTPDVETLPPGERFEADKNILFDAHSRSLDATAGASNDVLKPHARFFIRRDKSSVSISLDPPVWVASGCPCEPR